jgi:hypothetical protein
MTATRNAPSKLPVGATRLNVLLARESPMAVVFRRGPSKSVAVISWDTARDEFRLGQWLKGRIYEHRCDLSPSGQKLIYFVGSYRNPMRTWTAVSRPPFLTALLLWPKGDAWGGGGLFENERTILLNHASQHRKLAEGFQVPLAIKVRPLGDHAGRGEDDPIWSTRLERDGWQLKRRGKYRENKGTPRIWIEYVEKELRVKSIGAWTLEMLLAGIRETDGPWYVIEYRVVDRHGNVVLDLGRADWADWSRDGDLLFAKEGCLFRTHMNKRTGPAHPEKLIDLSSLKFEAVEPKPEATRWSGQPVAGSLLSTH